MRDVFANLALSVEISILNARQIAVHDRVARNEKATQVVDLPGTTEGFWGGPVTAGCPRKRKRVGRGYGDAWVDVTSVSPVQGGEEDWLESADAWEGIVLEFLQYSFAAEAGAHDDLRLGVLDQFADHRRVAACG